MDANTLISVVIPVWNHAHSLMKCLRALSRQTEQRFETIVVDDGSTDGLASLVPLMQKAFSFSYARMDQNRGAPAARNEGARRATGDYLLFLDADIVLKPQALKRMLETLEVHVDASFCYSSFIFGWKRFPSRAFDVQALKKCNYITTASLIRRGAFPGFDESLKKFQDWDLWLTIAERGGVGVWISEFLFCVKAHGTMSTWLPSIAYRLPWPILGFTPKAIRRYEEWKRVIALKHRLAV